MKAYLSSRTVPGYGPRVFIPYEHHKNPMLIAHLRMTCMWGGSDKDTGKCKGYEFSPEAYEEIQHYLSGYGFKLEEVCEQNADDAWAA